MYTRMIKRTSDLVYIRGIIVVVVHGAHRQEFHHPPPGFGTNTNQNPYIPYGMLTMPLSTANGLPGLVADQPISSRDITARGPRLLRCGAAKVLSYDSVLRRCSYNPSPCGGSETQTSGFDVVVQPLSDGSRLDSVNRPSEARRNDRTCVKKPSPVLGGDLLAVPSMAAASAALSGAAAAAAASPDNNDCRSTVAAVAGTIARLGDGGPRGIGRAEDGMLTAVPMLMVAELVARDRGPNDVTGGSDVMRGKELARGHEDKGITGDVRRGLTGGSVTAAAAVTAPLAAGVTSSPAAAAAAASGPPLLVLSFGSKATDEEPELIEPRKEPLGVVTTSGGGSGGGGGGGAPPCASAITSVASREKDVAASAGTAEGATVLTDLAARRAAEALPSPLPLPASLMLPASAAAAVPAAAVSMATSDMSEGHKERRALGTAAMMPPPPPPLPASPLATLAAEVAATLLLAAPSAATAAAVAVAIPPVSMAAAGAAVAAAAAAARLPEVSGATLLPPSALPSNE
ncbi:hypothetical protein VOLCADRAFT_91342 [Volvox carteri f. nagariensis]|uniref:Uncharacterized protein n=1 Tax=Volvox carteri f. nagariensis TaxID=3068 RepID=D8TWT8_VOLCA|nr:uncharacterized protein VOLCADRAFT_91342 [Volvox carteri f. nagariensis]EFJ48106.1 hypothetical protein VOLCADRAFT_91342 [Volvox carteri f. nagariensis]|eukprot:XP_002950791.1 hypothetical protein VOLCADRAFT_91342 [Volvox carteri f. nagariensis]